MIEIAAAGRSPDGLHYTGCDPFEARTPADGPGLSLKEAYQRLRATGAKVRLVPGEPVSALIQHVNALGQADLVLIGPRVDRAALARLWFYLARLLHDRSRIFVEDCVAGQTRLRELSAAKIRQSAAAGQRKAA